MKFLPAGWLRCISCLLGAGLLSASVFGQATEPDAPMPYDADAKALLLARNYLTGGEGARTALPEALQLMGWGVRNHQGDLLNAPPVGTATGLAMRDYELEELLWKPGEQPSMRFISFAQALAVPFEDADPEELAQDLVETIRESAESSQPQQRFWARFIVALGRVSPANYDLLAYAPPSVIPPNPAQLRALQEQGLQALQENPLALVNAMKPTPAWPQNDPVLAPSPRPERSDDDDRSTSAERDQQSPRSS